MGNVKLKLKIKSSESEKKSLNGERKSPYSTLEGLFFIYTGTGSSIISGISQNVFHGVFKSNQ